MIAAKKDSREHVKFGQQASRATNGAASTAATSTNHYVLVLRTYHPPGLSGEKRASPSHSSFAKALGLVVVVVREARGERRGRRRRNARAHESSSVPCLPIPNC